MLKKIVLILFCCCTPHFASAQSAPIAVTVPPDTAFLKKKMRLKKFSPAFTNSVIRLYDADAFASAIKLNMLGFLNPPQHSVLVTEDGIEKSIEFIEKNRKIFQQVEKRDHVPAAVIAALLWVETKHGKLTGRYHVTSVFGHLIQVTRTDVLNQLTHLAIESEKNKPNPTLKLKRLMLLRAKRKSEWAIDQMRALEKLYKKDKKIVQELQGSFAGAFGIPQFIPSSYFSYARPLVAGHVADLYTAEDAISSVSNYLKKTGWNSKLPKRQMKALMHYNNSQDYAESILDLSHKIKATRLANSQSP